VGRGGAQKHSMGGTLTYFLKLLRRVQDRTKGLPSSMSRHQKLEPNFGALYALPTLIMFGCSHARRACIRLPRALFRISRICPPVAASDRRATKPEPAQPKAKPLQLTAKTRNLNPRCASRSSVIEACCACLAENIAPRSPHV
jgi:hypothetical protein